MEQVNSALSVNTLGARSPGADTDKLKWRVPLLLVGVYLLALVPRLVVVLLLGEAPLNLDEIEYDRIAWNLSDGYGYTWFFELPTTFRPPGYPSFLALIYWVFGPDYYLGRIANALLAALHAPLTVALGSLVFGRRVGLIAGVIVALYVPLIFYAYALMSENLFIVLFLLSLILVVQMVRVRSWFVAALAGLMLGAAIMTTSAFAAFIVLLLAFVALRGTHHPGLWLRFAVAASVALLVTVPWAERNYMVTDRIMFLDSRLGVNLHVGFSEKADGQFYNPDVLLEDYLREHNQLLFPDQSFRGGLRLLYQDRQSYRTRQRIEAPISAEAKEQRPVVDLILNDLGRARALDYMQEHPLRSIALSFAKLSGFWSLEQRLYTFAYTNNVFGEIEKPFLLLLFIALLAPFPILVLMAVADNCAVPRYTSGRWLLLLPIAYFSAVHSVIFGGARFHFVIVPILALFAANAWTERRGVVARLWSGREAGSQLRLRRAACAVLFAGFMVIWIWGQLQVAERWELVFEPGSHQAYLPF